MGGASMVRTRFTPASRSILAVSEGPGLPLAAELYTAIVRFDGFVLARKVGYDDCVRLAAAMDAIPTPPINPMSSTTLR